MRFMTGMAVVVCLVAALGCQPKSSSTSSSATSSGSVATVSKYDAGPRAAEQPIDESRVAEGEKLFKEKGCSACHAFGQKLSGPDLNGVTMRRTAQWMENQILHPEVMTKEDPISRQLMATHALQMPNQGLTPEQAKSVIEFLKHKNHETAEHAEESASATHEKGDGR